MKTFFKSNKHLLVLIICSLGYLLGFNLLANLSPQLFPLAPTYLGGGTQAYQTHPSLYARANFDGNHYLAISQSGYGYAQQAFFPLYPLLISIGTNLNTLPVWVGVIISNLCFLLFIPLLFLLIKQLVNAQVAFYTTLSLLIFPTSFYFTAVYTESLFLLLVTLSLLAYFKKHWLLAGVFGLLAASTRLAGTFLLPGYFLGWWLSTKPRPISRLWSFMLIPLGTLAYMAYLHLTTQDALAFIHVQSLFGQNRTSTLILLPQVIWRYIKIIFSVPRLDLSYPTIVLELITGITFAIGTLIGLRKTRPEISLFSLAAYIIPTLTGTFASLPRYVLTCLSVFIVIGSYLAPTRKLIKIVYIMGLVSIGVLFTSLFITGHWVA